jgi:hypothetical protein
VDYWVQEIRNGNVPNDMEALGERFLTFETPTPRTPVQQEDPVQDPVRGIPDADPVPVATKWLGDEIKAQLKKFNMEPTDQFINDWVNGDWSDAEADLKMRDQQFWKDRFPGMEGRATPMSAAEYVAFEEGAMSLARTAGFPPGFYDSPDDFAEWIRSGRSLTQLNAQIQEGFVRLEQTPIEVKQAFARMQGIQNTEGALLAFILDPDRAQPLLEKQIAAAEVSGAGSLFGVNVGDERSMRLAERGFNLNNSQQTFQQLNAQQAVFNESITEQRDMTIDVEGVNAAFGLDPEANRDIERRVRGRVGALSGGGGLGVTNSGVGGRADS